MPLGFFAPHQEWAASKTDCGQHNEFRALVKALHAAGIEVVLDVVYNHTAEGDQAGPVYSFKGIDNQSYYMLTDRADAPYANFSGTGNSFNVGDPAVRRLVLDSLRYWTREMHVDGFRFDLASVFARRPDGSLDYAAPIFAEISADPELSGVRLIAEPWDATGTSQLGRAFPGTTWAQWNGQFRDDVRRFVRGDEGMVGALMQRLYGSDDLFPDDLPNAYRPYQSVNYVTSHDGLTLWDLLSYDDRDTGSWNSGFEGDAGVPPEVLALRRRQAKNLLCLLFLAKGTPMLRGGDEFLQTQGGNPNPYNQDNATSWLDWGRLQANADTFRFARLMIAFRKAHPSLARSRFWRGDVRWHGVGPGVDFSTASRSVAFFLSGASQGDDDLYLMVNGYWEPLTFTLQEGAASGWRRVVDTGRDSPDDLREPAATTPLPSAAYEVGARSVVVLLRPKGTTA
jgi:glycogen operon protein